MKARQVFDAGHCEKQTRTATWRVGDTKLVISNESRDKKKARILGFPWIAASVLLGH